MRSVLHLLAVLLSTVTLVYTQQRGAQLRLTAKGLDYGKFHRRYYITRHLFENGIQWCCKVLLAQGVMYIFTAAIMLAIIEGTSRSAAGPHQLYCCPYTQPVFTNRYCLLAYPFRVLLLKDLCVRQINSSVFIAASSLRGEGPYQIFVRNVPSKTRCLHTFFKT